MPRPETPVADLHCDLLSYLAQGPEHGPRDDRCRCSIPQMRQGGVAFQTLAIFCPTEPDSAELGLAQARAFQELLRQERAELRRLESAEQLDFESAYDREPILVLAAIENASAFCEEDERLRAGLERLDRIEAMVGRLLYTSLTWKHENRFGGGNESRRGLADDGRALVERLAEKNIAIDLSHASHWLAADVLDLLEARGWTPPVLASHSSFQAVRDLPRNLPDEIAREILRRDGVIGLNFLRTFLEPESPAGLLANVRHALALGGERKYCLGADFFAETIIPPGQGVDAPSGYFLPDFADASCYPRLFRYLREEADCPAGFLEGLAHGNAHAFLRRVLGR